MKPRKNKDQKRKGEYKICCFLENFLDSSEDFFIKYSIGFWNSGNLLRYEMKTQKLISVFLYAFTFPMKYFRNRKGISAYFSSELVFLARLATYNTFTVSEYSKTKILAETCYEIGCLFSNLEEYSKESLKEFKFSRKQVLLSV